MNTLCRECGKPAAPEYTDEHDGLCMACVHRDRREFIDDAAFEFRHVTSDLETLDHDQIIATGNTFQLDLAHAISQAAATHLVESGEHPYISGWQLIGRVTGGIVTPRSSMVGETIPVDPIRDAIDRAWGDFCRDLGGDS